MRASRPTHLLPSLLWSAVAGLGLSLLGLLPAAAHGTADAGLIGGASHPLLGLDHLVLLLAVGATSALTSIAVLPLAAAGAVVGAIAGSVGGTLPAAELLAALACGAIGMVLLLHRRHATGSRSTGTIVGGVLAAAAAIHALLHGLEASGQPSWWLGAALSSCLVVGVAHLGTKWLDQRWQQLIAPSLVLLSAGLTLAALA
ncbi:MAG: HupE/UreJ family protein [Cyanobacteriota bacterium]|nr:HupE/UreJ family protein [Cyanobacteriota bacterium]